MKYNFTFARMVIPCGEHSFSLISGHCSLHIQAFSLETRQPRALSHLISSGVSLSDRQDNCCFHPCILHKGKPSYIPIEISTRNLCLPETQCCLRPKPPKSLSPLAATHAAIFLRAHLIWALPLLTPAQKSIGKGLSQMFAFSSERPKSWPSRRRHPIRISVVLSVIKTRRSECMILTVRVCLQVGVHHPP